MNRFKFTKICVENSVSPHIVWEHPEFRKLVNEDKLTDESLKQVINENF